MTISRYSSDGVLEFGKYYGTAKTILALRNGISTGNIRITQALLRGGERLDTVAHEIYGDGTLWWIIAIASDIGWCTQVPAGTLINIPDPGDVYRIIG